MNSLQKKFYEFMIAKNFNKKTISAIMGNISAESAWKVDAIEKGNNIGFGLCQWSYGRRKQLEKYGTSFENQCEFLYSEITGQGKAKTACNIQYINKNGYISRDNFIKGNGTVEELTKGFCFCWERPSESASHIDKRIEYAQAFYKEMCTCNTDSTYYDKCSSTAKTITIGLEEVKVDSSYSNREKIAKANNISNYKGTAEQNNKMLNLLKQGKLKRG